MPFQDSKTKGASLWEFFLNITPECIALHFFTKIQKLDRESKKSTLRSLQSTRILKCKWWYYFQDKYSPAACHSSLSFFNLLSRLWLWSVILSFHQKKPCSTAYALSATSGFLDSSSVCFPTRQESNVSDAPTGELQFSCESMRHATVSLMLENSVSEFLLCAVDHQSNHGYKSTVMVHIFWKSVHYLDVW